MTAQRSNDSDRSVSRPESGEVRAVGRPAGTTSQETRRQILDAARQCFADLGFAGTSNKDIAERAGLTAASIRYHFGSKSDLFLAVQSDIQDYSLARCHEVVRSQTTLRSALVALFDTLGETQSQPSDVLRFNAVSRMEAARHPEIASDDTRWRALFKEIAELGVTTGEIAPDDQQAVRALLATLIHGLAHHAADAPRKTHRQAIRGVRLLITEQLISDPVAD